MGKGGGAGAGAVARAKAGAGAGARAGAFAAAAATLGAAHCPASSLVSCATGTPNALDVCSALSAWWGRSSSVAKMDWLLVPLAHFKQCTQQPPDKCLGPFGLNKTQRNLCCLAFRQAHPLGEYVRCLSLRRVQGVGCEVQGLGVGVGCRVSGARCMGVGCRV